MKIEPIQQIIADEKISRGVGTILIE